MTFRDKIPQRALYRKTVYSLLWMGLLYLLTEKTALWVNQSSSLEGRVYFILKGMTFDRGDVVGIERASYGRRVLKYVGGLAGDRIAVVSKATEGCYKRERVSCKNPGLKKIKRASYNLSDHGADTYEGCIDINGLSIGPLFKQTRKGEALHPMESQIIPRGCLFVYGSHPQSFDSRYQEFGLICNEDRPRRGTVKDDPPKGVWRALKIF